MKIKNTFFKNLYIGVLVIATLFIAACGTTQQQSSIKFDETSYQLFVGESKQVSFTVSNNLNANDVQLTSSDESVVSIIDWTITGLTEGTATLTATIGNLTTSVNVTVSINKNFSFTQAVYEVERGTSLEMEMNLGKEILLTDVTFTSSDKSIARFFGTRLSANKVGEITITATYNELVATARVIIKLSQSDLANIEAAANFDNEVTELLEQSLAPQDHIDKANVLVNKLDQFSNEVIILIEKANILKASIIDATIDLLPEVVRHFDEQQIKTTRDLYRGSEYQVQQLVTKLNELEAKEQELKQAIEQNKIDKELAKEIDDLILSLPTNPTFTDVLNILEVKNQYEQSHEYVKELVTKYSTLTKVLTKVVALQESIEDAKAIVENFAYSVELLPQVISSQAEVDLVISVLDSYIAFNNEIVINEISYDTLLKLSNAVQRANEYLGYNADTLLDIEAEMTQIIANIPSQILYDFKFVHTSLNNSTSKWSYALGQDESIHDLETGIHLKQILQKANRTLEFTINSGIISITKEISIDFGTLINNQKGLFYNDDPKTLSADEIGTNETLGWSGYTLSYGIYNMFLLNGNVIELNCLEDLSAFTILNPEYGVGILNNSYDKITIDLSTAVDSLGNKYYGNSAIVIRDNKVINVYKNAVKVTLLPGEFLFSTKDLDSNSITNNYLAPASSLKVNTKVIVSNWNKVKNPFILDQIEYLLVDRNNPLAYPTITAALEVAQEGATILVASGDYSAEEINITKSNLTIITKNSPITSPAYKDTGSIIGKLSINGDNIQISGFEFNNNLIVNGSNIEIKNNIFKLSGIDVQNANNLIIEGNYFEKANSVLNGESINSLKFNNNVVQKAMTGVLINNLAGLVEITDNNILNVAGYGIHLVEVNTLELFINRNNFMNIETIAIDIDNYQPNNGVANLNILYNNIELCETAIDLGLIIPLISQGASVEVVPNDIYRSVRISYNNFVDVNENINIVSYDRDPEEFKIYHNVSDSELITNISGLKVLNDQNEWLVDSNLYNEVVEENLIYPVCAYVIGDVHADLYLQTELNIFFYPSRSNVTDLYYISSNENILKFTEDGKMEGLKKGIVEVKAYFKHNDELATTFNVNVDVPERVEVRYDDQSWVEKGYDILLTATIEGSDSNKNIIWSSSDDTIAVVENGQVFGISEGIAYITATIEGTDLSMTVGVTVVGELDEVTRYVLEANRANVYIQPAITVTGYQFVYKHDIYSSVSKLYLYDNPIIEMMTPINDENRPGKIKTSVEYVTVHDTASSAETANGLAHANYVNGGGDGTSWHYTAANDGIYHQIPDNEVAYHAGDGTAVQYGLIKTDVKVLNTTNIEITIDQVTGNYLINGLDTGILAPKNNGNIVPNNQINDVGIHYEVGEDGYYYLGKTYYNDDYRKISNYGGNNNSIGIETCVNIGSDLYMTWQKTANLVGKLLIDNNLDLTRVKPHHFFSGKNCPQTMRDNNLYDHFLELVAAEYNFMKEFSGYSVLGKSNSLEYVLDSGRVKVQPIYSTSVSYDVIISNGETTTTITLFSVIPGQYNN